MFWQDWIYKGQKVHVNQLLSAHLVSVLFKRTSSIYTQNVYILSLRMARRSGRDTARTRVKSAIRRKKNNGCTSSIKIVSKRQRSQNSLYTYLECVHTLMKGGVAIQLRYSEGQGRKGRKRKNGCTSSTRLVSMKRCSLDGLYTHLECVHTLTKGGVAMRLRYSKG